MTHLRPSRLALPAALLLVAPLVAAAKPPAKRASAEPPPPALTVVAPAETPTERPWIDVTAVERLGRPAREPDKARLLRALQRRDFESLTSWIEQWQAEAEADPAKETWPTTAIGAFFVSDPRLEPLLEAWAEAKSASWVPFAVRGAYRRARGRAARGLAYARQTSEEQFESMLRWHALARLDLETALERHPALTDARERLMHLSANDGDRARYDHHLAAALQHCPACAGPRFVHAGYLRPRWFGSYEALDAYALEVAPLFEKTPVLARLTAASHLDRCELSLDDQARDAETWEACERALAAGPQPELYYQRAILLARQQRVPEAIAEFDRVLALDPQHLATLYRGGILRMSEGAFEAGARHLLHALRLDPEAVPADKHRWAVDTLVYRGFQREKAKDVAGARSLYVLAGRLAPDDDEVRLHRTKLVSRHGVSDEELATLRARHARETPELTAARELDDALLSRRLFDELLAVWAREIAGAPDDPRPYYERAGTLQVMRRRKEAAADLRKACRLGLAEACGRSR